MTRGRAVFITFEGADGSGKTTQLRLLAERLHGAGREVLATSEPGGTEIGNQIRKILLDAANHRMSAKAELLLYFAARAQNVNELILPALERGATVLSDRFTDSTLAYQGAGRGLGRGVVMELHRIACGGLLPALTVCLDIDLDTALARARARHPGADRMDEQHSEFHEKVRREYRKIATAEPARFRLVDGSGDGETVAGRVWDVVSEFLD